jgi:hypothetical protein
MGEYEYMTRPFRPTTTHASPKLPSTAFGFADARIGPNKAMSEKAAQTRRQRGLKVTLPRIRCLEKPIESED